MAYPTLRQASSQNAKTDIIFTCRLRIKTSQFLMPTDLKALLSCLDNHHRDGDTLFRKYEALMLIFLIKALFKAHLARLYRSDYTDCFG